MRSNASAKINTECGFWGQPPHSVTARTTLSVDGLLLFQRKVQIALYLSFKGPSRDDYREAR